MGSGANQYSGISVNMCLDLSTNLTAQSFADLSKQTNSPCDDNHMYPLMMDIKNNRIIAPPSVVQATNNFFTHSNMKSVSMSEHLETPVGGLRIVEDLFPTHTAVHEISQTNRGSLTVLGASITTFVFVIVSLLTWALVAFFSKQREYGNYVSLFTTILMWISVGIYWTYVAHPVYESAQTTHDNNLLVQLNANQVSEAGFVTIFTFVLLTIVAATHTLDTGVSIFVP